MRTPLTCSVVAAWCLAAIPQSTAQPAYQLQVIAQAGGSIDGYALTGFASNPSINDSGTIAFLGRLPGGIQALFTQDSLLVAPGAVIGGQTITSVEFGTPAINETGTILYSAMASGRLGLFTQSSALVQVGDSVNGHIISAIPWTGSYCNDRLSMNDAGTTAFYAITAGGSQGIFTQSFVVALNGDIVGGSTLTGFSRALISNAGTIAFSASYMGGTGPGLFTQTRRIARVGDSLGGLTLTGIGGHSINSAGEVVFYASYTGGAGIFSSRGPIVKTGDVLGGVTLDSFSVPIISDTGLIVFWGGNRLTGQYGLFTNTGPVVQIGDLIEGVPLRGGVGIGCAPFYAVSSDGRIAFLASLGTSTSSRDSLILARPVASNLRVATLRAPAAAKSGAVLSITATTKNDGPDSTVPSHSALWFSADKAVGGDALLYRWAVPALDAAAGSTHAAMVTLPTIAPGVYYLLAQADSDMEVAETSETDNIKVKALTVGPDLLATMTFAPPVPTHLTPTTITVTTKNNGGDTAAASVTRLYRSADAKIGVGDTLLGEWPVLALAPKATSVNAVTVTLPAGTYYLIAQVDATTAVAEAKETNNLKKVKKTVP